MEHSWLECPDSKELQKCDYIIYFLQNEVIFVQLGELNKLDRITNTWIRIYLQSHTST